MEVIRTIVELRDRINQLRMINHTDNFPSKVGFVPTMGYLHEGHMNLIQQAKNQCDVTVLSIFVNPLQFGANEDFAAYPKDEKRDLELAEQMNVDLVFIPTVKEMYPQPLHTKITVADLTNSLCGASRPGHFDGVATVVMKFFQIVMPDRAYFGMKDAQQLAVIQQMVIDLNMNIEIEACPILRESDGLAMSSRNVYLNIEEREQSVVLFQALEEAEQLILKQGKEIETKAFIQIIEQKISTASLATIDYIEIVSYPSMKPLDSDEVITRTINERNILIALAVKFGHTRLIDNRMISQLP